MKIKVKPIKFRQPSATNRLSVNLTFLSMMWQHKGNESFSRITYWRSHRLLNVKKRVVTYAVLFNAHASWSGTWDCTGTCWTAWTRWSMVMMMRVAARGNSMGWRGRARISTISTTSTACIACWIIVISRNSKTAWEGLRIAIHYCGFSKLPKVPISCARLTSKQIFQVFGARGTGFCSECRRCESCRRQ